MFRMNILSLTIALAVTAIMTVSGAPAYSQTPKKETIAEKALKDMTATGPKGARKKKVAICDECGKPEPECECEGHKDGEAKDARKEGDGHDH